MQMSRRALLASAGAGIVVSGCAGIPMTADPQTNVIDVSGRPGSITGTLRFGALEYPCMLGRTGILHPKFESDGGTPAGLFPLREVRYRPDRMSMAPKSGGLVVYPTLQTDGWCDDPGDPNYNKLVHLPYQSDAEKMWRDDHAYDVLAVIGYNDAPAMPGSGSAIFLHCARPDGDTGRFLATAGCVSLEESNLLNVLAVCTPSTMIRIRTI